MVGTIENAVADAETSWVDGFKPYLEKEALAALLVGISSGFPYAMIGATLTTRLAQDGIDKKTVTAFALAFLVYNFKFLWAWVVDGVKIPVLHRLGQRVSWMLVAAALVVASVINLGFTNPQSSLLFTAYAAIFVGFAGATFDIVIDAYRIEILRPHQQAVGAGMSQYGWRIGSAGAGALALIIAARSGWDMAYLACAAFAIPAVLAVLWTGEPTRRREAIQRAGIASLRQSIVGPFVEFFSRHGAWLVLLFILVHKIGDTLGQLTLRLLLDDMQYSNDNIAIYDVGIGFWAYLIGIFVGGALYARMGLKQSVLLSLILMMVSNFSFALLAAAGNSMATFAPFALFGSDFAITQGNAGLAAAIGFENFASGIGGVVLVAYFAALCDLRFTAAHYALISSAASIVGRLLTGTTAGAMVEGMGFFNYYVFTTFAAVPGIILFWLMMRSGLIDSSVGTAGTQRGATPEADD